MRTPSRSKPVLLPKQKKKKEEADLLFRNNPLPAWIYDTETFNFLDVNKAAVEQYGYSRLEFLDMRLTDILAKIDASPQNGKVRSTQQGSKTSGETTYCRKDGSKVVVEVTNQKWMLDGREAVMAVMQNASNHKQIEETGLAYSTEFHSLVTNAMDAIIVVDENQRITFFNPTAEKLFQWKASEVAGKPLSFLLPKRFQNEHERYADNFINSGDTKRMPGHLRRFMALRADGTEFPAEIAISPTEIPGKKHFAAVLRDMSEQQRVEDELRRAEANYRALVEQLPMMVYRNSASNISLTTYVSPQVKAILGYTPEEWVADPGFWEKVLHPEDHDRVMAEVYRVHQDSQPFDTEYRIIARDGHIVWFRDQAELIRDTEGNPLFWQGLMVDVTKSKAAQEALSESEDRYRDLVESGHVLICTHDLQGNILSINPWATHVTGYDEKDLIGKNIRDLLIPKQQAAFSRYLKTVHKKGFASGTMTVVTASDENRVWEYHNTLRTEGIAEPIVRGIAYDITERKMAEEALRESEERFRTLYENTSIGLYRTTPDGRILMANPALVKMLGYDSLEDLSHRNLEEDGNDAQYERRGFKDRIERDGQVRGLEAEWATKHGTSIYVRESAHVVRDDIGHILYYEGTVEDITERRRAEMEIRESENRYRKLFDESPICVWVEDFTEAKQYLANLRARGVTDFEKYFDAHPEDVVDCASLIKILDVNQASLPIFEADSEEDLLDNISSVLDEEAWPYFRHELVAISNGVKTYEGETVGRTLKGRKKSFYLKWVEISSGQDTRSRVLVSFVDVTERKKAEESVRISEAMYRGLFDTVLDGIFRTAPDGKILSANPALIRMLGYQTEEQVLALNMHDLYLRPEIREHNLARLNEAGEVRDRELELKRADGTVVVALENSRVIRDANDELLFYEGTLTDITERKRAEEALRASEAELQALLDAIPDVILVLDKYGRYLKIAPTDPNLLYMPAGDLLGKRLHDVFSRQKADEFVKYIQQTLQTHKPVRFEYAMLVHDRIVWFSGATAPLTEDAVVWVARDITPQKESEQQMRRRLDELEALYESGLALSQLLDPKKIGEKIIQILSDRLNWHHAAVRIRRGSSDEVELLAFSQNDHEHEKTESDYAIADHAVSNVNEGISGWVIKNGRIVNSADLEKDPRYHPTFVGMRSGLYVPIWASGRVLGCISVESSQREGFQQEDERFLTTLASQAASALENARLFESERQRRLDAEMLRKAASVLTSSLNREQILDSLLNGLSQIIPFNTATVFIEEGDHITEIAEGGVLASGKLVGHSFPLESSMQKYVREKRGPVILADAQTDPRFQQWKESPIIRGWLGVPLIAHDEIIGYLAMGSDQPGVFNESHAEMLSAFASHAAAALDNARLFNAEQRRRLDAETLMQAAATVSSSLDLDKILDGVLDALAKVILYNSATIFIREADGSLKAMAGKGLVSPSKVIGQIFPAMNELSEEIFKTGRPIVLSDAHADPRFLNWGTDAPIRGWMGVPLTVRGEVIGYITFDSFVPNAYTEADSEMATAVASQAAAAIENSRLYSDALLAAERRSILYEVSQELSRLGQDIEQVYVSIHRSASRLMPAEAFTIALLDEERGEIEGVYLFDRMGRSPSIQIPYGMGLSSRVIDSGQTVLVNDDFEIDIDAVHFGSKEAARSILAVPMRVGGKVIGAISAQSYEPNIYNDEDRLLLEMLASQAAIAIENARLYNQVDQRIRQLESLNHAGQVLTGTLELRPLLENILHAASQAIPGAEKGTILLREIGQDHLHVRAQIGYEDSRLTELPFDDTKGYSGQAYHENRPLLIRDSVAEYELPYDQQLQEVNAVQSAIVAPLVVRNEAIGVIALDNASRKNAFTEQDLNLLTIFASSAAQVIENSRLFEQTRRRLNELDALTRVSSALRIASTRAEMTPIILTQLREILHADGAIFITVNPNTDELVDELAEGSLEFLTGLVVPARQGITAQVIQSRQVYSTANLQDDPRVFAKERMPFVRSAVIAPLVSQETSLGALWVTRDEKNGIQPEPFADNENNLLIAIADMAANAIQRAKLHEETTTYNEQLIVVNRLGRTLAETLDLPVIYQRLAQFAIELLPDTAIIYITELDEDKRTIRAVHAIQDGEALNVSQLVEIPLLENEHGALGQVVHSGEPMIVNNLNEFFAALQIKPVLIGKSERQTESALYVPMIAEGKVIGILQAQSYSKNRYMPSDAKLLSLVANTAAVAIQNSRLFGQLKHRVDQLSALHMIDTAINSTTDLRLSLQAVLENVTRQLKVDAACILLLNPSTLVLQYAAGVGFFTLEVTGTSLALGKGNAGRAALERQTITVPDLSAEGAESVYHKLAAAEKFIGYCAVPLVAKGEVKGVMELFDRARLDLDEERASFLDMLASQAALAVDNALLFENLERANIELTMAYDATIEGWSQALELRDQETQGHSARVMEATLRLGAAMGLSDKDLHDIRRGVLLHDIGKMGIPDSILHKPGPLTNDEWIIMRKHPQYAYDMLAPIAYLRSALDIPYCHHEKWDGSGYPRGLRGETIPLAARLFAVVDVYDALTTDRAYRKAWSRERAIEYIINESGKHFDPAIVSAFLKLIQE